MAENNGDESLISHLEALRETLLKCVISLCVIFPFAFLLSPAVFKGIVKIITKESKIVLNFFSPAEVFIIQVKIAFILALIMAFPYIAKKIWDFILPALYDNEKKFIKKAVLSSTLLFILGVVFCICVILPLVIKFGLSFASPEIHAFFGVSNVINLTLFMSCAFGIMFQTPLIAAALIKSGIVSYGSISSKRPYVAVIILVLSAILTPPDIISQLFLAIPAYILFEAGLIMAGAKELKKKKETEEKLD